MGHKWEPAGASRLRSVWGELMKGVALQYDLVHGPVELGDLAVEPLGNVVIRDKPVQPGTSLVLGLLPDSLNNEPRSPLKTVRGGDVELVHVARQG